MTTTRTLHRRTVMLWTPSSDGEYYSSREELRPTTIPSLTDVARGSSTTVTPQHPSLRTGAVPGSGNYLRTPGPQRGTYGLHRQQDPWGDAAPTNTNHDPEYPAGSWEPGDRERALAQNEQEAPGPFARDNGLHRGRTDRRLPQILHPGGTPCPKG